MEHWLQPNAIQFEIVVMQLLSAANEAMGARNSFRNSARTFSPAPSRPKRDACSKLLAAYNNGVETPFELRNKFRAPIGSLEQLVLCNQTGWH